MSNHSTCAGMSIKVDLRSCNSFMIQYLPKGYEWPLEYATTKSLEKAERIRDMLVEEGHPSRVIGFEHPATKFGETVSPKLVQQ